MTSISSDTGHTTAAGATSDGAAAWLTDQPTPKPASK